ncbi:PAS domain-containing protein [uncultured Sphingomonas sp.]|uniref:PAS domain-containing protein n=1 Tax=uncultured Sphingomonas sp. TaxID=158754 RepID=UPI0025D6C46C|nr:PAS domain-containing protein [uncultured Sphingomonas sp.]
MRVGGKNVPGLCEAALTAITEAVVITEAVLTRPGPTIVYVNPAFEAMTGYAADEVIGRTPRMLQGRATDRDVLDRLREGLEQHGYFHGEAINYRKDGTPYVVEWVISAIRGEDDDVTHWVAAQRDITVHRASADHQRALYADVVQQIRSTTSKLRDLVERAR